MKRQRDKWIQMFLENIEQEVENIGINCSQFEISIKEDNVLFIACHDNYKIEIHKLNEEQCSKLYSLIKAKVNNKQSFRILHIEYAILLFYHYAIAKILKH